MAEQTQNSSAPAAASDTSAEDANKGGQPSTQPASDSQKVDTGKAEDNKGNSAASDGQDGAESDDGGRQRPSRAERRISELTAQVKKLQEENQTKSSLTDQLQKTPIDSVQLPDYSQMTEITPDQLKKDIINAASQIVDLKMTTTANVLEKNLSNREASEKSARAIEATINKYSVLNPNSDDYDADLDHEITDAYAEVVKTDPGYTFDKFIKPFTRVLDSMSTETTSGSSSNRGTSANRGNTASSRKSAATFDPNWDTEKMEQWFASRR